MLTLGENSRTCCSAGLRPAECTAPAGGLPEALPAAPGLPAPPALAAPPATAGPAARCAALSPPSSQPSRYRPLAAPQRPRRERLSPTPPFPPSCYGMEQTKREWAAADQIIDAEGAGRGARPLGGEACAGLRITPASRLPPTPTQRPIAQRGRAALRSRSSPSGPRVFAKLSLLAALAVLPWQP